MTLNLIEKKLFQPGNMFMFLLAYALEISFVGDTKKVSIYSTRNTNQRIST